MDVIRTHSTGPPPLAAAPERVPSLGCDVQVNDWNPPPGSQPEVAFAVSTLPWPASTPYDVPDGANETGYSTGLCGSPSAPAARPLEWR
ncbi:hypothetical protein GCM10010166_63730 [Couchioplanes caeruleus subsp. azureus]|nr:hypothetical protein GCM10010166_63730 [Couchioplanes caeruleus subsp. azureus]